MSGTEAGKLLISIEATAEKLRQQLAAAEQAVNASMKAMQSGANRASNSFQMVSAAGEKASEVLRELAMHTNPTLGMFARLSTGALGFVAATVALTVATAEMAKEVAKAGEGERVLIARLEGVTGSAEAAAAAVEEMHAIAAKTGVQVEQMAGMFTKLSVAADDVGLTQKQVQVLVKTLEEAGVVAGASAEQVSGVGQSLTIAMLQGVMNARQFRTILGEMPALAKAIADATGQTVSGLMDMARHGRLTADVLTSGVLKASEQIETKFQNMPLTMTRAWGQIKNELDMTAEALDGLIGISNKWANALGLVAASIKGIREAAGGGDALAPIRKDIDDTKSSVIDLNRQIGKTMEDMQKVPRNFVQKGMEKLTGTDENARLDKQLNDQIARRDAALAKITTLEQTYADKQAEIARTAAGREATDADTAGREGAARQSQKTNEAYQKFKESLDKREKLNAEHTKRMAEIDKWEVSGLSAKDVANARALANKDYKDGLAAIDAAEAKHGQQLEKADEKMRKVVESTAEARTIAEARAATLNKGSQAVIEANIQEDINNKLIAAGIPITKSRTSAQEAAKKQIEENVRATAEATANYQKLEEQQRKNVEEVNKYANEIQSTAKRISEDASSAFFDALTGERKGAKFVDYFKTLFKRIAVEAISANIMLPITTSIVGSMPGLFGIQQPSLTGAVSTILNSGASSNLTPEARVLLLNAEAANPGSMGGGGGALGMLGNISTIASLSDTLGLTNIASSVKGLLGIGSGGGGGIFNGLFGGVTNFLNSGIGGTSTIQAFAAAQNIPELLDVAAAGGGTGMFGGASIGSLLGGAGLGFGLGSLVSGFMPNKTNSMIGSGIGAIGGALGGAALGGMLGSVAGPIGGVLGAVVGGLFGPGPKHMAYSVDTQIIDNQIAIKRAIGSDTENLNKALQDVQQGMANINQLLKATPGLTVSLPGGYTVVGGGNNVTQYKSFEESMQDYRFAAKPGSNLAKALENQGGMVASSQALSDMVTFITQTYDKLSATTSKYQQQIDDLNKTFDDATAKAQQYGLATDVLDSERARQIKAIQDQADAARAAVQAAPLGMQGRTFEQAQMLAPSARATAIDQYQQQLKDVGLSAEDAAHYLDLYTKALDDQQAAVILANKTARDQAETQLQMVEATAAGNGARTVELQRSMEATAAIKTLHDNLVALGETDADVAAATARLTDALRSQTQAAAAAAQQNLAAGYIGAVQAVYQALGVGMPQYLKQMANDLQVENLRKSLINLGATADDAAKFANAYSDALTQQVADQIAAGNQMIFGLQEQYASRKLQAEAGGPTLQTELMDFDQKAKEETASTIANLKAIGYGADQTAEMLKSLEETQGEERAAIIKKWADQANATLDQAGKNILNYIDKLTGTPAGGASPYAQYMASQASYSRDLALAQQGNTDALDRITTSADALIAAGRLEFGSGTAFQALVDAIEQALLALPATQAYSTTLTPPAVPHALGGAFAGGGGVVAVPTYRPMALMGEAGPEAIMPLRRDRRGRLGVSSSGDDTATAFAQVGMVLRDEIRGVRNEVADLRSTMRRMLVQ